MESDIYSSEESWTNSQFSESKDCGYQTRYSLPESYVSSRPRPTIPRPPSCPAVPISHRPSIQANLNYKSNNQRVSFSHHPSIQPNVNYKSNDQRWKFRPTTG